MLFFNETMWGLHYTTSEPGSNTSPPDLTEPQPMGTMGQGHWDDLRHGQSSLLPVLLSLTPQVSGATGQGLAV